VCTGSKSEELARKAVKIVVQKLRKEGIKIKKDAVVTVQNIVSSINLGGKSILKKLHEHYLEACMNQNNFRD
jgi:transcription initiation factor TFIID TATA-box-binding protein